MLPHSRSKECTKSHFYEPSNRSYSSKTRIHNILFFDVSTYIHTRKSDILVSFYLYIVRYTLGSEFNLKFPFPPLFVLGVY